MVVRVEDLLKLCSDLAITRQRVPEFIDGPILGAIRTSAVGKEKIFRILRRHGFKEAVSRPPFYDVEIQIKDYMPDDIAVLLDTKGRIMVFWRLHESPTSTAHSSQNHPE